MLIPYRATHNQVLSVFSIWKQRGKENFRIPQNLNFIKREFAIGFLENCLQDTTGWILEITIMENFRIFLYVYIFYSKKTKYEYILIDNECVNENESSKGHDWLKSHIL